VGLVLSLFIRRRRLWVRADEGDDGRTVVRVAGLARTENGDPGDDLDELLLALRGEAEDEGSSDDGRASAVEVPQ
jgi:cytochrome c biogenesis protein